MTTACVNKVCFANDMSWFPTITGMTKYIHGYFCYRFTGNYGVLGVLDRLHGTDKVFRESSRFKKHRLIFSAKALT